jgi:hypothetical protein
MFVAGGGGSSVRRLAGVSGSCLRVGSLGVLGVSCDFWPVGLRGFCCVAAAWDVRVGAVCGGFKIWVV